jgi:energy-converting hydrogenase A subunit M
LKLQYQYTQAYELHSKRLELAKRREEARKDKEKLKTIELIDFMSKQQANVPGMPSHLNGLSDEELERVVAELKEYEGLEIKTIVASAEIVFCD